MKTIQDRLEEAEWIITERDAKITALESRLAQIEGVLRAVADEVRAYPESPRSFSGDSYLPQHIVDEARAALQSVAKEGGAARRLYANVHQRGRNRQLHISQDRPPRDQPMNDIPTNTVRDALLRSKRYILDIGDDRTMAPEVESLDNALAQLALASAKVAEGEADREKAAEALREADIALDCTNEFLWREVYEDAQNGPDSPPEPANVIAAEAASHCRDNQRVRELIRAARTQETTQ